MTRPPAGYLPLAVFFPIKFLTSLLVLYGLYTDTGLQLQFKMTSADIILALSYFGLITFWSTRLLSLSRTYLNILVLLEIISLGNDSNTAGIQSLMV